MEKSDFNQILMSELISIKEIRKEFRFYLRKLTKAKRSKKTRIAYKLRRKFKLSHRTLFYIKEYSNKSNIPKTIIKQSFKILILASIISSIGGMGLQYAKENIITILPLLIVLPALTDMVGDFGTITASKFTTLLFFRAVTKRWWRSKFIRELFTLLFILSIISAIFISMLAYFLACAQSFVGSVSTLAKVLIVTMLTSVALFALIFAISIFGGFYVYKRKEDPNNFLIPLTTSIADFASLIIFSFLVVTVF